MSMPGEEPGKTEATPAPREEALAARIGKRIENTLKSPEHTARLKRWKNAREYAKGQIQDDGKGGLVRVNIIGSRLEIIQPSIYAKNPEISVTASEQINPARYAMAKRFAHTLELTLAKCLVREAKLKKRGKAAVRAALTTTVGWVKLVYQRDLGEDPLIRNRMNDIQDNLERIRHLQEELTENDCDPSEHDATAAELELQLAALEKQLEVVVAEGLVIDNLQAEDILILDDSITSIDEYPRASALAHGVWMGKEEYEQAFGHEVPRGAKTFLRRVVGDDGQTAAATAAEKDAREMVRVWETWDRTCNTVYTQAEGAKQWARDPYHPPRLGEQWYPFFPLQFKRLDGELFPPSTVEDMIELQDEYNTTRTHFADARKEARPGWLFDKSSGVKDEELQAIRDRKINDVVGVTKDKNERLDSLLAEIPTPSIDPSVYDTSPILRDVELVSGAQDAAAGSVQVAKTATEAEILKSGENSRTGERLDVIEDWLTDIATYAAQLLLQEMSLAQVQRIAGPEAVWPQMTKDELFELVEIQIRAGSTAKPNRMREREQWSQLLPTILDMIDRHATAMQMGNIPGAEAIRKLLDETLKRFDERLNVDDFIPPAQVQAPAAPALPPNPAETGIPPASHGAAPTAVPIQPEALQVQ